MAQDNGDGGEERRGGEEFSSPFPPPPPKKHSHTMMLPAKEKERRSEERASPIFVRKNMAITEEKELSGNQNGNNILKVVHIGRSLRFAT